MSRDGCIETWSREIMEDAALPQALRDCLAREYEAFPYCILAPATSGIFGEMPETCLCLDATRLGVFRAGAEGWTPFVVDLYNCYYLELGRNLLLSWITVAAAGERHVVWFNTASEELYRPFMEAFRRAREKSTPLKADLDSYLASMLKTDYRFFTYPRSTLAGRVPEASFYHPLVRIKGGIFRRKAISSYFLALANGLFYAFSEERVIRSIKTADYSLVIRYIPIGAGDGAFSFQRNEDGYSLVELSIGGKCVLSLPIADSSRPRFKDFSDQTRIRVAGDGREAVTSAQ